jgi:hypothetical protein
MEAATAPGRNLAMGIAAMGQGLGKAIEQYRTKKAETEAATQSWETVSGLMQQQLASDPKYLAIQQYMETGALPQGVSEQDIPRYTQQVQADREMLNKFSALGEKFPDMSLAKKKAALGDAVMVLNQYRTDQQNQLRDQATRQQLQLGALQLEDAINKRKQQNILTEAIRYGIEQPTTTTQTQQVTDTIEFPPMPGVSTPAVQATPSQAEATAARYFMGQYGQAAQDLARYGTDLGRQAEALNISSAVAPKPASTAYEIFGAAFQGLGSPLSIPPTGISRPNYENQIQAAARAEENIRLKQQQLAESQAAIQQAGIMSRSPALQTISPRMLQPEQQAQPIQQPPQTITRNISTQVPISYEDQSKRLTQYLIQQGATPETIAMVPQILERVGQRRPTTIEQVGNLGSVIRFGDKEQFVPNPKTDIGDILKVRGLTINSPEFRGQAPTEAEAKEFREQYSNVLDSRRSISRLIEIAQLGKAQQQTPEIKAEAEQLAIGAQGALRLEVLGPGTVTEPDREILKTIVPNPTRIFSLQSSNIKALKSLLERAGNGIETKAKALGLEVLNPKQQSTAPASGGVLRWNTVTKKLE